MEGGDAEQASEAVLACGKAAFGDLDLGP